MQVLPSKSGSFVSLGWTPPPPKKEGGVPFGLPFKPAKRVPTPKKDSRPKVAIVSMDSRTHHPFFSGFSFERNWVQIIGTEGLQRGRFLLNPKRGTLKRKDILSSFFGGLDWERYLTVSNPTVSRCIVRFLVFFFFFFKLV